MKLKFFKGKIRTPLTNFINKINKNTTSIDKNYKRHFTHRILHQGDLHHTIRDYLTQTLLYYRGIRDVALMINQNKPFNYKKISSISHAIISSIGLLRKIRGPYSERNLKHAVSRINRTIHLTTMLNDLFLLRFPRDMFPSKFDKIAVEKSILLVGKRLSVLQGTIRKMLRKIAQLYPEDETT